MTTLRESFEDVADWCERHLEDCHGRRIEMTFGAMLRAYGHLATMYGSVRKQEVVKTKAEDFLQAFCEHYLVAHGPSLPKVVDSNEFGTNMIYDADPPKGPDYDRS